MISSPLRFFNKESIDTLLEKGIDMQYHPNLLVPGTWDPTILVRCRGSWDSEEIMIKIEKHENRDHENITILHEWLHAYEDLIVNAHYQDLTQRQKKRSRDGQIEWWAKFHYKNNPEVVEYIRQQFK